jgi:TrmH family RNA methyltransferase
MPDDATLVLVVDGVRDPGNLGTLIRSSAAVGADMVALLPDTVDATSAKVVRSTAGLLFTLPVRRVDSVGSLIERSFVEAPQVVLADAAAERDYDAIDWRRPTIVIIGGEAFGASEQSRTYADISVRIPISPATESLNAAVAGSILLFEAQRQRRRSE